MSFMFNISNALHGTSKKQNPWNTPNSILYGTSPNHPIGKAKDAFKTPTVPTASAKGLCFASDESKEAVADWTSRLHISKIKGFLRRLGCEEYADTFVSNKFETLAQVSNITYDELKEMNVEIAHRKKIMYAINGMDEDDIHKQKNVKCVENPLVMFFGMSEYQSTTHSDLDDIWKDAMCLRDVFEGKFQYRFISNCEYNKTWNKQEAEEWIQLVRDNELIQKKYDSLIFCGASHGSNDAMICSDGNKLKLQDIRSFFSSQVNDKFGELPKIFIFNCCRTPYEESGQSVDQGGVDYSVTIAGKEGQKVFGPKLSQFVAYAFTVCSRENDGKDKKMNVSDTLYLASEEAKETMKLRLEDYDQAVGRVVFLKRPKGRGVASDPSCNSDDCLTNVLRPQKYGSKMDLFYKGYYDALFNAGFQDKASLQELTKDGCPKDTLSDIGITMVFHQKELLKRIANLYK